MNELQLYILSVNTVWRRIPVKTQTHRNRNFVWLSSAKFKSHMRPHLAKHDCVLIVRASEALTLSRLLLKDIQHRAGNRNVIKFGALEQVMSQNSTSQTGNLHS